MSETPHSDPDSVRPPIEATYVEPNPGTARTFGTLNIVFASLLLLCGGCYGFYMAMLFVMMPAAQVQQRQMNETFKAQRAERIAKLKKEEEKAETEEEKQAIADHRQQLEARPIVTSPDMSKMLGQDQPAITGFFITDVITGLLLNLLMLISGIGLLGLNSWARRLAVWVAGLKLLRLAALCVIMVGYVVPTLARIWGDMMEEMMQQMNAVGQAGGPSPQDMQEAAVVYGMMLSAGAIALLVFGSIYPAFCLWFLTRPRVKAACDTPRTAAHLP